ncbi:MAG: NADH-quinone oxidoreductase subunit A [Nitrospira sp.]|nr:NADH-quinone oxidoreductase subunit A [Nitrospira sp.]
MSISNSTILQDPIWQVCVYGLAVGLVIVVMLGFPALLGERHWKKSERRSESATVIPYESGIRPTGSAQVRPPVQYYLVAMFFVIFDVEAAFLYAWAVAVPETGWLGFIEVTIFVALLLSALIYLWLTGALDWNTQRQRSPVHHLRTARIKERRDDRVA